MLDKSKVIYSAWSFVGVTVIGYSIAEIKEESFQMKLTDYLGKLDVKCTLPLILISLYPRVKCFFLLYHSQRGIPKPPDTLWYLEHAERLLTNFSYEPDFNGLFYLGYYSLLALFLAIFKTPEMTVLAQVIISAFSVVLVYRIGAMLFSKRAGFAAGMIYAYTWPLIYWSQYILTDTLFMSVLLLTVYFLLKIYQTGSKAYICLFTGSALYMVFFRPTGVISLAFIFIYILIHADYRSVTKFLSDKKLFLLGGAASVVFLGIWMIQAGKLAPLFTSLEKELTWLLSSNYSSGHIFDWKSPYDYKYNAVKTTNYFNSFAISFFINNWAHILILYAKRAVFFWAVWIWDYTPEQILENVRYFVPVYLLSIIALGSMIKHRLMKRASILILVILSIQVFCILFFIDVSFRYRAPSLVFLNIIAGYGADRLIGLGEKVFYKVKEMV